MKKILFFVLAVVLVSALANCAPAKPTAVAPAPNEPTTAPQAKPSEPVRLVFKALTWIKAEQDKQKALIDQWNAENPDIQVDLVAGSWPTMSQELLTAFETGDVPDIFHYSQPIIADWKNLGYLEDMSGMITAEDKADVNPDVWAGLTNDKGQIIGIPIQYEVDVTYYNVDIFKKNNIEPPTMENPWTFDQLVEVARKLQGTEGSDFMGMGMPGPDHFGRVFTELWAPKIGDQLVYKNADGKYYVKLGDESIALIKKLKGLIDEGIIGKDMLATGSEGFALDQFLNGKSAMLVGYGCWYRSMIINEAAGTKGINWGVAAPFKVNSTSIYGYTQTLSVPSASKHKAEAFAFLKWYWKSQNVLAVAKAAFIMPGRNSAIKDPSLNTSEYSWDLVQKAVQKNVIPAYVSLPGWGQFTEGVALTLFGDYWAGNLTLDQLVERFNSEGTRILQENN